VAQARADKIGANSADESRSSSTSAPSKPSRLWLYVLLTGACAVFLYVVAIPDYNLREIEFLAAEALGIAVLVAAMRFRRPARPRAWALICAGIVMLMLGDATWDWLSIVQNVEPTPSFADVLYLAEYPFLIAGVILVVQVRLDRAMVMDTLTVTLGGFLVVWELLVRPYLDTAAGSPLETAIAVAYPVSDVAILAVIARLFFEPKRWSPALRLIAIGLAATLFADLAYLRLSLVEENVDTTLLDGFWLMSIFFWVAAACHPSARREPAEDPRDWLRMRALRRPFLAGALLLLPATLVLAAALNRTVDLPVFVVTWTAVAILVALRLDGAIASARESESRFRILFEGSPAGMAMARAGRVILANESVRWVFGLAAAPEAGGTTDPPAATNLTDLVAADSRTALRGRIEEAEKGGLGSDAFETVGRRSDGSTFPLIVKTQQIDLPEGSASIVFFSDVSAERAAGETLRASERRYRELFEGNPLSMLIYDTETLRILAVNDTMVRRYGWSPEEFATMTIADIRPPEEVGSLLGLLQNDRSPLRTTTVRHRHADGSIIWADVTSHEGSWDGRPARVVLAVDATERIRLEEQLRQAQKMEAVGRLAGGVAHDFNNLLTAISGYAGLLRGEFDAGDARIAEVDEILLAGSRAAGLTRQLLAFSRRQVLQPRILNLNESIDELRSMLVRLIGEDVELQIRLGPDLGLVRADPGQLTQVLMNLAVNARDAMPHGGRLTLETANVELDERFARAHEGVRPGPHVKLAVSDTGAGMELETVAHLFEPFFTTKDPGKGTGLGLATVYGIVRQSEGSIDVRTEPGRGSTFTICLPMATGGGQDVVAAGLVQADQNGHETVLVVEDEESVRRLAISVLERQGYHVLAADGPAAARKIVADHAGAIDLLLTDVVMPGGTGPDLAAAAIAARPELKVLMMSGYAQDAILSRGPAGLGAAMIEKPFTPNLLLARVRIVLDGAPDGADRVADASPAEAGVNPAA
jgi:hypothetical protein